MDVWTMLSSEKLQKIWKKSICLWIQCFPLKISNLTCSKDIKKALLKRSIKGYIEMTTLEWSCFKINIRMVYLRTIRIRTLGWYSNDVPESRQDRFWDDYIRIMYWTQDHGISIHQNENASESTSKWWRT